jgi:hypothetical protein
VRRKPAGKSPATIRSRSSCGWRFTALLGSDPPADSVSQAFWHACTAGERRAAEYLLSRGADLNWEPEYAQGTPLDAASVRGAMQENVISWLRELGARSASTD